MCVCVCVCVFKLNKINYHDNKTSKFNVKQFTRTSDDSHQLSKL